jgi:hypothetical protein
MVILTILRSSVEVLLYKLDSPPTLSYSWFGVLRQEQERDRSQGHDPERNLVNAEAGDRVEQHGAERGLRRDIHGGRAPRAVAQLGKKTLLLFHPEPK